MIITYFRRILYDKRGGSLLPHLKWTTIPTFFSPKKTIDMSLVNKLTLESKVTSNINHLFKKANCNITYVSIFFNDEILTYTSRIYKYFMGINQIEILAMWTYEQKKRSALHNNLASLILR